MNKAETTTPVRHEPMRIAGHKVDADNIIEVTYPYTGDVIGTVPAGQGEHARRALQIAAAYKPNLTRFERQKILFRTAELLTERADDISRLLTLVSDTRWPLALPTPASLRGAPPAAQVAWDRLCGREGDPTISALLSAHARAERLGLDWKDPIQRAIAERATDDEEERIHAILAG